MIELEDSESLKNGDTASSAEKSAGEAKSEAAKAKDPINTAHEINAIQYAIVILQALEGQNQEDATREVTVEGAQKLQDSQGSSEASTIPTVTTITTETATEENQALDGSNLACAANSMAYLLSKNPVDTDLLNTSSFDLSVIADRIEVQNRRNQLLQQYAASAEIIAEGSNAISEQFYDRVSGLAETAPTTFGTLGAMSVLNDSERYPYFEMVRQVALSGVQLGLKGAVILNEIGLEEVEAEEEEPVTTPEPVEEEEPTPTPVTEPEPVEEDEPEPEPVVEPTPTPVPPRPSSTVSEVQSGVSRRSVSERRRVR